MRTGIKERRGKVKAKGLKGGVEKKKSGQRIVDRDPPLEKHTPAKQEGRKIYGGGGGSGSFEGKILLLAQGDGD